jgi:hypothetical protein
LDDDSSDDTQQQDLINDQLVNEQSSCTKGQALCLVFAFFLRHNLTKTALQDLLALLNILSPNCVPGSKYLFEKFFFKDNCKPDIHFYCPQCKNYLAKFDADNVHASHTCKYCVPAAARSSMWLIKKNFFFLTKSIAGQLIDMLQNRKLWGFIERGKSRSNDENCRSEIFTGALYKKLSEFLRGNFNFTMAFATDGVQVFKSSNYAIWPLFCTI